MDSEKDPSTNWITEGVITQLEPNIIVDLEFVPNAIDAKFWRLDKFMNRTTYQRMIKALQQLCSKATLTPSISTVLTGFSSDKIDAAELAKEVVLPISDHLNNLTLNTSQNEAIRRAFSRRYHLIDILTVKIYAYSRSSGNWQDSNRM